MVKICIRRCVAVQQIVEQNVLHEDICKIMRNEGKNYLLNRAQAAGGKYNSTDLGKTWTELLYSLI